MKKKSVLKQVAALTLALGISLSSSLVSYATEVKITIKPSTTYQTIEESRTFMDDLMEITYQKDYIMELSDANTTFTIDRAKTTGIDCLVQIEYGYIEGDKFIYTYTDSGLYKTINNMDGVYSIFDKAQVQKDQQDGITDRVYVAIINGWDIDDNDCFIPFLFRLSATPSQTEGWVQDSTGWWYRNADGSYPANVWKEINGKQYYFGADGYMLKNTRTPDNYYVGLDGTWDGEGRAVAEYLLKGVRFPALSRFAVDNLGRETWGIEGSEEAMIALGDLYQSELEAAGISAGGQGPISIDGNSIVYATDDGTNMKLKLVKEGDYYELLLYSYDTFDSNMKGVLLAMCHMISSTPQSIYDAIYCYP